MTLAQLEHAATLADPLLSDTLYRLLRTCREYDDEANLVGRVERLAAITTDPVRSHRFATMLAESKLRRQRCESDILNLARLLVKEAEVTE